VQVLGIFFRVAILAAVVLAAYFVFRAPTQSEPARVADDLNSEVRRVSEVAAHAGKFSSARTIDTIRNSTRSVTFTPAAGLSGEGELSNAMKAVGWTEVSSTRSAHLYRKGDYFASIEPIESGAVRLVIRTRFPTDP
jgi:hypothetical protein